MDTSNAEQKSEALANICTDKYFHLYVQSTYSVHYSVLRVQVCRYSMYIHTRDGDHSTCYVYIHTEYIHTYISRATMEPCRRNGTETNKTSATNYLTAKERIKTYCTDGFGYRGELVQHGGSGGDGGQEPLFPKRVLLWSFSSPPSSHGRRTHVLRPYCMLGMAEGTHTQEVPLP